MNKKIFFIIFFTITLLQTAIINSCWNLLCCCCKEQEEKPGITQQQIVILDAASALNRAQEFDKNPKEVLITRKPSASAAHGSLYQGSNYNSFDYSENDRFAPKRHNP